jgi:Secretion system C-terminal sorting domain
LHGISLTDYNNATAVGDSGTILRTTNGGTTWDSQLSGTTVSLLSVFFSDANNGTTVGGYLGNSNVSLILRTSDGGKTWLKQSNPSTSSLRSVWFTDANNGTAVGDYGTLLRTTNGGITFIGKENNILNPQEFILSQNYPNPFNPVTTINYSIPKQSNVKIKVYNILGKEILTLVNETKPQGNYSVEFNANNLSSGVYFYRLSSGQFLQVKKMLLIK